jgi:tetratricopeptide (TPR) repeat protein
MRSWINTLVVAAFLLCFCGIITGQTPSNAVNFYQHGTSKLTKNDLDGAINDFTKAIELSSRLGPAKNNNASKLTNEFTTDAEAANVTVVDPFTAQVYCNRGIARMRKGDYDMAIQDFTHAIRIRPNLTEAYLNRGAAKRAIGDPTGALADTEKALSFNGRPVSRVQQPRKHSLRSQRL